MTVSIIVAVAANGTIGRSGDLPWRLPADLRRFKRLTLGHHLLVGRKTWESIGHPLPGRTMVVITRDRDYAVPAGVQLAHSLGQALAIAEQAGDDEVFVGGGAEVYRQALPRADRIYFTEVGDNVDGDTLFPEWNPEEWKLVERQERPADDRHAHTLAFLTYERG